MSIPTRPLTPSFSVAAQLSPADMAHAAALGFKTIINNRPDQEGGAEQPLSRDIEAAAHAAGLAYVHLPVVPNAMTPEQVQAMQQALAEAATPVLAFCRSGARSTQLFTFAKQHA